jgi:hypothetical protein
MRPFGGAMDLINTDHGDLAVVFGKVFHEEALWGYK